MLELLSEARERRKSIRKDHKLQKANSLEDAFSLYMSRMSSSLGSPKLVLCEDSGDSIKEEDSEDSSCQEKRHFKLRRDSSIVVRLSQSDITDI